MEGQTATETPVEPALGERSATIRPTGAWREWLRSPFSLAIVACVALAALSAAVLPTVPSYDPWSWIVWGREVVDPHLSFAVGGGPSWKPLPVIFTAVFGLFGGAAPTLWVITARAGGLLAAVAAYRLGARLGGGGVAGWAAGAGDRRVASVAATRGHRDPGVRWAAAAGLIAALAVLLTQDWAFYMFRGTSEPMLVGATLWAVERHLAGRHGSAFVLGVAASLIRPEAWPFILLYGAWLWRREPRLRVLVGVGLLAIPFFWFVPPWIGSGQPFLAASHAKAYNGHLGSSRLLTVLKRGADLQTVPVLIAALVAVGLAWFRERDRLTLALAGGALAWWVIVVGMTLDGYPGLERFYLPAAGIVCVLAGVGVVRAARLAGAVAGGVPVAVGVAVLLIAVAVPFSIGRINTARAQEPLAARAVTRLDQLSAAVAAVGGHHGVYPCRSSFTAVNHGVQTALAWKLHVTLGRVGTSMRHQGLMFVGPHDTIDGQAAAVSPRLTQIRLIAHVGAWRVYRVTAPGASTRCAGT